MKHLIRLGLAVFILHAGLTVAQENEVKSAQGRLLWSHDAGG
jgi:hypothetical protein